MKCEAVWPTKSETVKLETDDFFAEVKLEEIREDGIKAVRYEKLVPVLIQAIKELETRVKTLESS